MDQIPHTFPRADEDPAFQEFFEKLRLATEDFTQSATVDISVQEAQILPIPQWVIEVTFKVGCSVFANEQSDGSISIFLDIETLEEREERILQRAITPKMREDDERLRKALAYAERRRKPQSFGGFLRDLFGRN